MGREDHNGPPPPLPLPQCARCVLVTPALVPPCPPHTPPQAARAPGQTEEVEEEAALLERPSSLSEVPRCPPPEGDGGAPQEAGEGGGQRDRGQRICLQLPQLVWGSGPLLGGGTPVLLHLCPRLLAHWGRCHTRL